MDYPLIWSVLIATTIIVYVILDGFDLGIGILTGHARSDQHRSMMTATIGPVWNGNAIWLILGGCALFAAFPLAYAVLVTALYMPILVMLLALIFRKVAFVFLHRANGSGTRTFWNKAFQWGSSITAFFQGIILGAVIQGMAIDGRVFAGDAWDWLTPFSILTGLSVFAGYTLLGATWLVLKLEGEYQELARSWARRALFAAAIAMTVISLATLSIDERVTERWGINMSSIDLSTFLPVSIIPAFTVFLFAFVWKDLDGDDFTVPAWRPYLGTAGIFLCGYLGLAVSLFPYLVPFELTVWDTAASGNDLKLLLVVAAVILPITLMYTAFVYKLYWGKVK